LNGDFKLGIFAKFGDFIIKLFSFVGMLILSIPKIPEKIRNINTSGIRDKIDTESVKGNISRIRSEVGGVKDTYSRENYSRPEHARTSGESGAHLEDPGVILISGTYTSEEKERTILILQIASAAFIVVSIFYVFNFLSLILFLILGGLIGAFVIYMLYNRVTKMYRRDFNAYRDFFLLYLAVGIVIVLVSSNPSLTMAFSFQSLPSLSVLIYAIIAVVAVFLIFRIKYHRNYTFGTVLEAGENTAHVKVEYDIRSNVKPDIYLVENRPGAVTGDTVKLKIEEKIISTGGNKPLEILEVYEKT
jgi:uncharacterized membrane protein